MNIFPSDPRDLLLTLNDFPLYGVDAYGCEWHVTFQDVSGLFDGVESTLKTSEKVMTDGWYSNLPRLRGRTITIEGYILGRCTEACVRSWTAFKSILNPDGMLLVARLGGIGRQVQVLQSVSAPVIKWAGVNMLRFSISLTSLSPYLYGLESVSGSTRLPHSIGGMTFPYGFGVDGVSVSPWTWSENIRSGRVNLLNDGNAPSQVLIRIDGPVVDPSILHVGSGRTVSFDMSLDIGHYVTIDGTTHEILIDGTDPARGRVVRREWGQAEVGENVWAFSAGEYSPTARMTVSFYPAYM